MIFGLIIAEGKEAYYNEVPPYKNPHEGEKFTLWAYGWEAGETEHRLFTENQSLKAENESIEVKYNELKGDIDFAKEEAERHLKDKLGAELAYDICFEKLVEIRDEVKPLILYIERTNFLFLSRERMMKPLKKIIEKLSIISQ